MDNGFGINRNGRLFAWLGDLYEFFSDMENGDHLHRFLASNIESDHDIISNYYFRDIGAEFIEHDNELRIIELKNEFEELVSQKFDIKLFNIDITELKNEYKSPIMNEKTQTFNAYTKINSLLIENIDRDELKKILLKKFSKDELKGLGGLKLLEKFFSSILQIENSKQLISPLFVLYDLRILDSHLSDTSFDDEYKFCKERIGVDPSINHIDFFREVIKSIVKMFEEVNDILKNVS